MTNKNLKTNYGKPVKHHPGVKLVGPKRKRKPSGKSGKCNTADRNALCRAVCARVDPFSAHSCCKQLDSSTTKCFSVKMTQRIPLTTGSSSGKFALHIAPHIASCYQTAATWTGDDVTTWSSATNLEGYNSTDFSKYRIVSAGVRFFSSSSATTSKGLVGMAQTTGTQATFDTSSSLYQEVEVMSFYEADMTQSLKLPSAAGWVSYSDSSNGDGLPHMYVYGTGMDTSLAAGYAEITFNLEVRPKDENFAARLAGPGGPSVPQLDAAISNVRAAMPAIVKGGTESFARSAITWVQKEVETLINSGVDGLAGILLGVI